MMAAVTVRASLTWYCPLHLYASARLQRLRPAKLSPQVKYALDKYSGDPKRVFVTGSSSGGMVTNVLLATYPDVFAAGASFSGAPAFACWNGARLSPSGGSADPDCATTKKPVDAAAWGALALSASPGYTGPRPAVQIWHGTTDTVVAYSYLADALGQWSSVHSVAFSANVTDDPVKGYTKMVYGDGSKVVGYSALGVGHIVPFHEDAVLKFFGLLTA
jgi:acetylxylan esterase